MALPLLLGAAKGLAAGAAKGVAKGAAKSYAKGKAKKFIKGKKGQKDKGGPVQKQVKTVAEKGEKQATKGQVKPQQKKITVIATPAAVYNNKSDSASQTSSSNVSYDTLQKQLDSINKTTKALSSGAEKENKVKKQLLREQKKNRKDQKAKAKEEQLEKKKRGGGTNILGGIVSKAKEFNFFDFLKNIALGALAVSILDNIDAITGVLNDLIDNFSNPMNLIKGFIVGMARVFKGPIKGAFNLLWKGMKKTGNIVKAGAKKIGPTLKKAFGGLASGLLNFGRNIAQKLSQVAGGGFKQAAKTATSVGSQKAKALAATGTKAAKRQASAQAAKNILGKGAKRVLKVGKVFTKVPVIGGLLSIFIDMLLGEPLDRAVVGAIGGGIGAWIGGGVGSLIFPFLGTAAGAVVGGIIGDWAGKALYKMLQKKIGMIGVPEAPTTPSGLPPGTQLGQTRYNNQGQSVTWTGPMGWQPTAQAQQFIPGVQIQPPIGIPGVNMQPFQSAIPGINLPGIQGPQGIQTPIPGMTISGATNMNNPAGGTGASGASPANYTSVKGPSSKASHLYSKLGITSAQWKTYKDTLASIETSGYGLAQSYGAIGGTGKLYDGRYQMGDLAKKDAARILGISVPSRQEFRNNPQLQEDMILAYTYANHTYMLGKAPTYDQADGIERLTYLGFGHNQGWANAVNWLNSNKTLDPTRDGFGTSGTKFTDALRRSFGAQPSQSTPTMQPLGLGTTPVSSQNTQSSQAQLSQQQNQTVVTQGTINDMFKGGANTKDFVTTSPYGDRTHPITGERGSHHSGIDIAPPGPGYFVGLKVPGKVTRVSFDPGNPRGYGHFVIITSQQTGMSYMFAHLVKADVKEGEQYTGQPIGEIGNTGGSTGIHVHFEVYKGGKDGPEVDPTPYQNLLTMGKIDGQVRSQTAQVSPNQSTPNMSTSVSSRPSYDPYSDTEYAGGNVALSPTEPQTSGGGGGGGVPMMGGPSTQEVLNSYYKSQLLGFLYKQG